jgi:aldose 1-epimerase
MAGDEASVEFSRISPDGEEGYPGNLQMRVTYTLTNQNELLIRYHAVTDQPTIVNVTNHSYFNLSGNARRDILDHQLQLQSDQFLELDAELIPTGKLLNVEGTPFDFRRGRKVRSGLLSAHNQNQLVGRGYDHPFLLKNNGSEPPIVLSEEISGRRLRITTDDPYVVLYTGNSLPESIVLNGAMCTRYLGLCLETQGAPDAINHPHFPSIILEHDQVYSKQTTYAFSTF